MKLHLKPAIAGAATLALAGGALAGLASPAFAVTPWNPDPNSNGRVVFYDASGNVITGGNDLTHIADFVASTGAPSPSNATKATLYFATPKVATPTGSWPTDIASTSQTFPNATYPAPLTGPGFTKPVAKLLASNGDGNLTNYIANFPNTDSSTPGYVNVYQVRLVDGGPGAPLNGTYAESDILVNTTAGTWTLSDPSIATTTTSISATETSPQVTGTDVHLHATVSPAADGTIKFLDGATQVGTTQTVTTGSPTANVTATAPAIGTHHYTAVFSPAGGTLFSGSTSSQLNFVITAPIIGTTTALSVNPGTTPQYGAVDLTANITAADASSAGQAGSVQFFSNGSSLGTVSTNDGTAGEYKLHISSVTLAPSGTAYQITAAFTPSSSAYGSSSSSQVPLTVTAATCPGSPVVGASCSDPQNIEVTVNPGSLTITTPYTPTNHFVLPAMVLNPEGTLLSTSARFPKTGDADIVVTSSLAGDPNWTASVSATDLTSGTNTINGENLGLTGGTLDNPLGSSLTPNFPTSVGFTAITGASGTTSGGTGLGLKGGPHPFAQSTGGGNGAAQMHGTLSLTAPPQTAAGVYNGTITFSVA